MGHGKSPAKDSILAPCARITFWRNTTGESNRCTLSSLWDDRRDAESRPSRVGGGFLQTSPFEYIKPNETG